MTSRMGTPMERRTGGAAGDACVHPIRAMRVGIDAGKLARDGCAAAIHPRDARPRAMSVLHIFLLAVAAALYPTLLAGVIIILGRPQPVRLLAAFLLGGMIVSIAVGLIVLNAMERSGGLDRSSQPTPAGLMIAVGLLSLGVAYAL